MVSSTKGSLPLLAPPILVALVDDVDDSSLSVRISDFSLSLSLSTPLFAVYVREKESMCTSEWVRARIHVSFSFQFWYYVKQRENAKEWKCQPNHWLSPKLELHEITVGFFSLNIGAFISACLACWVMNDGYSKLYFNISDYGYLWFLLQWPAIFIMQVNYPSQSTSHVPYGSMCHRAYLPQNGPISSFKPSHNWSNLTVHRKKTNKPQERRSNWRIVFIVWLEKTGSDLR